MNKIMIVMTLLLFVIPYASADLFKTGINISMTDGNLTIHTESGDHGLLHYNCSYADITNDDDYTIYIERNFTSYQTQDKEVMNLTKSLIQHLSASNISKEYISCIEGRAIDKTSYERCKLDRDEYNNESKLFYNLLLESRANTTTWEEKAGSYQDIIGDKNEQLTVCNKTNEDLQGKPMTWGLMGIVIGIIATNIFIKNKQARSSEQDQFGGY